MAGIVPQVVPVQRTELVTRDVDLLAGLVRDMYVDHTHSFRCPDPERVDGVLRSGTVNELNASLTRYGGFAIHTLHNR